MDIGEIYQSSSFLFQFSQYILLSIIFLYMPPMPFIHGGMIPLLQWILMPTLIVCSTSRQIRP
jgi:hypothetical protein